MVVKAEDRLSQTKVAIKIFHVTKSESIVTESGEQEEKTLKVLGSLMESKAE